MVDSEIRARIKECVTFNAPCFNDRFIENNKFSIHELVKARKIKEYQGSGDLVSELMNNISKPIIIEQIKWKGKELMDDHFIYAMALNGDRTEFVIDKNGKKNFIPIFVNRLVDNLLSDLSEEETTEIISLAENIMDSGDLSMKNIRQSLKESDVSAHAIKVVLLHTTVTGVLTFVESEAQRLKDWINVPIELVKDTKTFIVENIKNAKEFIVSAFIKVEDSVERLGKDVVRSIIGGPINLNDCSSVITTTVAAIGNFMYNSVTDKRFSVNPEILKTELTTYKSELVNVEMCINKVDKAINNLIDSGWSGQASSIFFNVKFIMYKNSMEKCK
ncbi:hypothetical protein, partial [Clostridium gasigenes]